MTERVIVKIGVQPLDSRLKTPELMHILQNSYLLNWSLSLSHLLAHDTGSPK